MPSLVSKMNADPAALGSAVRAELGRNPRAHGGSQPSLSARLRQVTAAAEAEAGRLTDEYVSTEHLFVAIASEGGKSPAARLLGQRGITRDRSCRRDVRARIAARTSQNPEATYDRCPLWPRPHRARAQGQARSGLAATRVRRVIQVRRAAPRTIRPHRRTRRRQDGRR